MQAPHYEVIVRGRLGPTLVGAFDGLTATSAATSTVLRGDLDQAALHGLLARIEALGLELLDVRRI